MLNKVTQSRLQELNSYTLPDGSILLDKVDWVPTHTNVAHAQKESVVHRVKPDIGDVAAWYGVTSFENGAKLVALSNTHKTVFYWFEGSKRISYRVNQACMNFEECWEVLFKSLLLDDTKKGELMFMISRPFVHEYFGSMKNRSFHLTLSGKWKGLFVHVDVERFPGMRNNVVMLNVNGQDHLAELDTHPLVKLLG